jgi:hypothetical protein
MTNERHITDAIRERPGRAVRAPLPDAPGPVCASGDARAARDLHTISLNSAYGNVLEAEEVSSADFPGALRRIYRHALEHASAVVVVDGITHTRNAFLEFVREYRDCAEREQRKNLH